ncbi:SusC/RagA family TonB-linked outer membrane protein [Labilibaculum sp.]|uniref:SusC/RagA family TonB-linked outer membrane protein n=1 Tax=Labilibaculum sp. TaxID=2060723 RepID=UPI003563D419
MKKSKNLNAPLYSHQNEKQNNSSWLLKSATLLLMVICNIAIVFGQNANKEISGKITDSSGGGIPGVNISLQGTTVGTVSDIDGNYFISANSENVIVYSFIGYTSQEILVGEQNKIDVVLLEDALSVDEVVVVGYGVQKKSLTTGSISSVKADDLLNVPVSRADQAMQGKTAGVSVLSTSGSPGASTKIRVRGTNSNGDSNPLFIVDGMKTGDINNIDPSDIQSMEILKDAASAAIYGTEGANGVIIITTKTGKAGASRITYDFQYGIQSARSKVDLLNAEEYKTWMEESGDATITLDGTDTDWLEEIYEPASVQKHHIGFSGGTEKTSYMISTSYFTQNGIIGDSKAKYDRLTTRVNVKSDVKDWLEVGNNFSYAHSKQKSVDEDDVYGGIVNNALLTDPTTPVVYDDATLYADRIDDMEALEESGYVPLKDGNGNYYGISTQELGEVVNPIAKLQTYHNKTTQDKFLGSLYTTLKPIKGLKITSRVGLDLTYQTNHSWNGEYYLSSQTVSNSTAVTDDINKWYTWLWESFASYDFKIDEHNFTILAGYSAEEYTWDEYNMTSGYLVAEGDSYAHQGYADSDSYDDVDGTYDNQTMTSMFSRLSYDYKNRYMFEASLRRDAASVFPEKNRAALFPAASVGWIFSEEDFFDLPYLDYAKLRASWGQNGSKSNLSGNQDIEYWSFDTPTVDGDDNVISGSEIATLVNTDLKWEKTEQFDIGMDLRALDGKLSLGVDYYKKVTKNLIVTGSGPLSVGNAYPAVNGGDVTNKGLEFEVGYRNSDADFKYSINANVSTLDNEVTKLTADSPISGDNLRGYDLTWFEEGYPIWYFKGYKTDGIDPTTGNVNVVDVNEDGEITSADQTYIGDPHPDLLYGFTFNAQYKGFDFNLFIQGSQGNDVFMGWFRTDRLTSNKPKFMYNDRWTATNTDASNPTANNESDYIYRSDRMVGDGSYLRFKQIQLGYNLSQDLLNKTGIIKSARVYVSLDDYFTITNYKGLDPEAGSNTDNRQGVDRGIYPVAGKIMFGLSVNF